MRSPIYRKICEIERQKKIFFSFQMTALNYMFLKFKKWDDDKLEGLEKIAAEELWLFFRKSIVTSKHPQAIEILRAARSSMESILGKKLSKAICDIMQEMKNQTLNM